MNNHPSKPNPNLSLTAKRMGNNHPQITSNTFILLQISIMVQPPASGAVQRLADRSTVVKQIRPLGLKIRRSPYHGIHLRPPRDFDPLLEIPVVPLHKVLKGFVGGLDDQRHEVAGSSALLRDGDGVVLRFEAHEGVPSALEGLRAAGAVEGVLDGGCVVILAAFAAIAGGGELAAESGVQHVGC